jgi:hypothetical protein
LGKGLLPFGDAWRSQDSVLERETYSLPLSSWRGFTFMAMAFHFPDFAAYIQQLFPGRAEMLTFQICMLSLGIFSLLLP